eukprot:m.104546 g.104546  ORF g.104546 m.104546 type:complete len:506 (+) comp12611_c0_seq2:96-1613(+)
MDKAARAAEKKAKKEAERQRKKEEKERKAAIKRSKRGQHVVEDVDTWRTDENENENENEKDSDEEGVEWRVEARSTIDEKGPASEPAGVVEPPAEELAQFPEMTLELAQEAMARGLPDGPEKRVAQYVLLREAARLEALMASMNDESDAAESEEDESTSAIHSPEEPSSVPTTLRADTDPQSPADQFLTMTVDEAQAVMAKGLPHGDPEKNAAKRVLLREASRLEEMMAKLDMEDEDEQRSPPPTEPQETASSELPTLDTTLSTSLPPQTTIAAEAEKQLQDNAIFKATKLAESGAISRDEIEREVEERRRKAQAEARKLVGAQFDVDALKEKERQENLARLEMLKRGGEVKVPEVVKVSREYATEDERVQAEASVEQTHARLEEITFDFSFSASDGTSAKEASPPTPSQQPDPTSAENDTEESDFQWGFGGAEESEEDVTTSTVATPKAEAVKSEVQASNVDWKKKKENARKYATEDERHAAEASVEETHARLEEMTFDFSFGS